MPLALYLVKKIANAPWAYLSRESLSTPKTAYNLHMWWVRFIQHPVRYGIHMTTHLSRGRKLAAIMTKGLLIDVSLLPLGDLSWILCTSEQ